MAISKITVSDVNPVNSITVTDSNDISVVTVGIQGPGGPNAILGRSIREGYTAGSSDNGAGIIYDHANVRWLSTVDSDAQSLNFKIPNLTFLSGQTVTAILDEDNMGSNSNTALATQQSIKAYVDAELTSQDLDFQGDSGGALSIDLDSETLDIAGGTGIDTSGSGNTLTVAIDSTVTTLTGTQTLTNKTLTSPVLNTVDINGGDIDSATTINKSPTITLGGDLSGSVTLTELGNGTLTATIVANSVALGTDTTGNYVATIAAGEGIDVSGSGSETAAVTISAEDATSSNKGIASFDATDFSVSSGDVTVNVERVQDIVGGMVSSNTENGIAVTYDDTNGKLNFDTEDFVITLSGDLSGAVTITNQASATLAATIVANSVALGTDTTGNYVATIAAGEGIDVSGSGSETAAVTISAEDATSSNKGIASFDSTDFTVSSGAVTVNVERIQDVVGAMLSSNTESGISVTYDDSDGTIDFDVSDPVITLSGDVAGSATMTNLGDVTISTTIQANSVALGTDTTGNYVAAISAGEGIDISGSGSETATVTISAEDATDSNKGIASFDSTDFTVTSGAVTVNAERIQDITGAMFSSNTESGITATYQDSDGTIDLDVADFTITLTGDVAGSGTVTNLGDVSFAATIQANSVALGTDTTGNYVATIADAGNSRITVANSGSETAAVTLDIADDAIGTDQIADNAVTLGTQSTGNYVATIAGTTNEIEVSGSGSETAAVTIGLPNDVTIGNDLTVTGDLTVNGTTTTINTANLDVEDSTIRFAKNATTLSATNGAGLEFGGSSSKPTILWNNSDGRLVANKIFAATSFVGDVAGNASTATALETARTIHGVSFDGTANIDLSEVVQDTVGAMFSSNTETGLSATYQDSDGTIDLVIGSGDVTNAMLAGSIANDKLSNSSITVSDGSNSTATSLGGTITFSGTANEVEVAESSGTITVGLPSSVDITTDLSVSNVDIATGSIVLKNSGSKSKIDFYCESSNAHYTRLEAAPHASYSGNVTVTLPTTTGTLALTSSSITGNAATATALQNARTIHGVSFDGTANIDLSEVIQDTVGAMFSSNTETGISASYEDSDGTIDLVIGSGDITNAMLAGSIANDKLAGSIANNKLANSTITVSDGSNSTATALGGTITFSAGEGIDVTESSGTVTIAGEDATSSNKGIASFTGDFSVSSGAVSLGNSGVTAATYGSATAIPVIAIDAKGRITSASTASISTSFTLSDGSNTQTISGGDTLTVAGTNNEVNVAVSATDTLTIGLPDDVTIGNDLTVSGNLTVTGTTTQTGSVVTDNNFTGLTNANTGNSTDFGFYGKYVESSTTKYAGIFYDASTDNTFRLFVDTQTVPSTTVNTGATGYAAANLVVGGLTASSITIGSTAVTSTAAELNILDGVTSSTAELNILDGVTSTTAELNILDGVTATTAELNIMDGNTSASSTTLADADRLVVNDNGTMKQVALTDLETYVEGAIDTLTALGTIGASGLTTNVVGNLTVNTNAFAVDRTNSRIGIAQASPTVAIDAGSKTDAILLPKGTTAQRPTGAAGQFRYNTTLGKFEGYTSEWGEIGGGTSTNTFEVNTYTGDGSTTAFTLSQAPDSEDNIIAFIEGVYQNPNDFVLNGTTLTFDEAPANSRKIVVYHVKGAVAGQNLTISTMTGDGSDTTLTLSIDPISENNVQVYIDGVYQNKDTFSVSGTTLTFSEAPPNGSKVEAMTLTQTDINTATILTDADGDTKVQVEESSDEDKIRFDTAGSERVIIDNAGKVGIGESTPLGNLHVKSGESSGSADANADELVIEGAGNHGIQFLGPNNSFMQLLFGDNNDSDVGYLAYDHTNNALSFGVNAAERARIDSSGNFGIGTSSPASKLHISATGETRLILEGDSDNDSGEESSLIEFRTDGGAVRHRVEATGSGGNDLKITAGADQTTNTLNSEIIFETKTANSSAAERMRIDADGNVGIGVSSIVREPLQVHRASSSDVQIHMTNTSTGTSASDGMTIFANSTTSGFWQRESANMLFATAGSERMRIQSGGNVSIGSTTANAMKLNVDAGGAHGVFVDDIGTGYDGIQIRGSNTTGSFFGVSFKRSNNTLVGYISVGSSSTDYVESGSDLSLKENVEDWNESVADKFKDIKPVTFNFISDESKETKKGYIAQNEVDKFPEAYPINPEDGKYYFAPNKMVTYLMKAIQEQQEQIESMKKEIEELKG